MADSDNKHMDIAKPGAIKIQTGSKPMVVGHKPVANDPTIKPDIDAVDNIATEANDTSLSKTKIKLQPLTEEEKEAAAAPVASEEKSEDVEKSVDSPAEKKVDNAEPTETKKPIKPDTESTKEENAEAASDSAEATKETPVDDSLVAREERLQDIIASKEYFVPIREKNNSGSNTFVVVFLITLIFALVVVLVLLDAGVLDIGITPPTDFI